MHSCRPLRVRIGSVLVALSCISEAVALPAPPGDPTEWFSRSAPVGARLAGLTRCLAATCGEVSGSDAGSLASWFGFSGVQTAWVPATAAAFSAKACSWCRALLARAALTQALLVVSGSVWVVQAGAGSQQVCTPKLRPSRFEVTVPMLLVPVPLASPPEAAKGKAGTTGSALASNAALGTVGGVRGRHARQARRSTLDGFSCGV